MYFIVLSKSDVYSKFLIMAYILHPIVYLYTENEAYQPFQKKKRVQYEVVLQVILV